MDEIANVPHSRAMEKKPNYEQMSQVYKKFWTTCEDAYIFGVRQKKEIDISQMEDPSATFYIRSKQSNMVKDMVNYLLNIPDKSTKQMLCVMPVGHETMPTKWHDIENGKFYIIKGQHSIAVSKIMFDDKNNVNKEEREHFHKWNCFVVWSNNVEILRCISAYYNRTNHFVLCSCPGRLTY